MRAYQTVEPGGREASPVSVPNARPAHFTTAVAVVARHPNAAILRALVAGPRRFNELAAEVRFVPELTVSGSLRELDADGLIARRVEPGPPLRVLYELTPLGESLVPALIAIGNWADGNV
jgi:DNA-binding HxlR family transcriptional regulator